MTDEETLLTLPYGTFWTRAADYMNADIQRDGFWDLNLKPVLDAVPVGSHVIDVGAHVGLYAGYLAARGCLVEAVEANPAYQPLLERNVHANDWGHRVHVRPTFCYSRDINLYEVREHPTRASNTWLPARKAHVRPRRQGALARPLDAWGWAWAAPVHVLKVDTQGADLHVLLGAEKIIQRDHPDILIEYEADLLSRHGHSAEDYRRWRVRHGYDEETINGGNQYWRWSGR
jgi:FkbM family methyltransferase